MARAGFDAADSDEIERMLDDRTKLHQAIVEAAERKDFAGLMATLSHGLDLNTTVLDLLASRFQELVRKDREQVRKLLAEVP